MVNLVADRRIVEAAQAIDAEIWPIHLKIKAGVLRGGDWFELRDKIESRQREFVNVVRQHLTSSGPPLRRLTGRPPPDDPLWRLGRLFTPPAKGREQSASS